MPQDTPFCHQSAQKFSDPHPIKNPPGPQNRHGSRSTYPWTGSTHCCKCCPSPISARVSLMDLTRILGLMASCQDIIAWSRFRLCPLQQFLLPFFSLIEQKTHRLLSLIPTLRSNLNWWLSRGRLSQGMTLDVPQRQVLTTDASLWVGGSPGRMVGAGKMVQGEMVHSINWLELQAIWLALHHFQSQLVGSHALVGTDNTTVKAHINHQGGTKSRSLMCEAPLLFLWAKHFLSIRAEHLAGVKKRGRRLAQPPAIKQCRVATPPRNFPPNNLEVGSSFSGSLRIQGQYAADTLFLLDGVQRGRGSGCTTEPRAYYMLSHLFRFCHWF